MQIRDEDSLIYVSLIHFCVYMCSLELVLCLGSLAAQNKPPPTVYKPPSVLPPADYWSRGVSLNCL